MMRGPSIRPNDERGSVIVIVALALFAMALTVSFVVDVANFFEHRRHLQLQADAAALAGAHSFSLGGCDDTRINNDTRDYGGSAVDNYPILPAHVYTARYNYQIGGTDPSKIYLLINSSGYYGDTGAGNNTDSNGSPCAAKYVDVKLTETHLPWYLGFGGFVDKISAHARVALVQESQSNGSLPIAVPNPLPTSAAAIFINEGDGSVIAAKPLSDLGPSGSLDMWSNAASPASVTIPSSGQASVVIALSGKNSIDLSSNNLTTICDEALTDCYDLSADPPTRGLTFIRGYSASGSGAQPNAPILRSVELFNVNCPNTPYFSNNTTNCTYEVVARIDAGTGLPKANQIYTVGGIQMDSSTDPNCSLVAGADQCWHANLTLTPGSAANNLSVTWEETTGQVQIGAKLETCTATGGNKCKGTFAGVAQRAYSATKNNSGPIQVVRLFRCDSDPSCSVSDFQSYPTGDVHTFVVSIGIAGTLQNATSPASPIVALRVMQESPHTQSLDCDPGYSNLKLELQFGCRPSYVPNGGSPDCSTLGASALWATAQPWSCVAVQTGGATNDPAAGLNSRIFGAANPPPTYPACGTAAAPGLGQPGYNNWANYNPNDPTGNDGFPPGDPRILNAFITSYGAFSHITGSSGSVPVIGFGHFYVTGWTASGGGFAPPTNCNMDPVPGNDPGVIVGRFIRYIDKLGGFGTQPCDPNSINSCVIVMTK